MINGGGGAEVTNAVAAAYSAGLRIAEVANLKVADVEWRMFIERGGGR